MRGKLVQDFEDNNVYRFIPAHAGKTGRSEMIVSCVEVHPRACGENLLLLVLSPIALWFIPAHAGKT